MRTFVLMKLLFGLMLSTLVVQAQTISHCRRRFDSYLNFKGRLSDQVVFSGNAVFLQNGGKRIFAAYEDELAVLGNFFSYTKLEDQGRLFAWKGARHLSSKQLDSINGLIDDSKAVIRQGDSLPLRGYRVALDPGHFATNMKDAAVEQKYLYFPRIKQGDTINLFESQLTFHTASILKHLLEEKGAEVFLTRQQADFTSYGCSWQDFLKLHRRQVLDSLKKAGAITPQKHRTLMQCSDYDFFWNFFRDFDLANRAAKINRFNPHLTAVIHYNVDEKNTGWKTHSDKNFTMAFIGGAFTPSDLARQESRLHFLRLLLTDQLERSEKLAGETVQSFKENLKLPVARPRDATYLYQNCISTSTPGVYCRNLVLCRKINSPLVYGESLYQDNVQECGDLMRCDLDLYGVRTSQRVAKVASSYYEAIYSYITN